MEKKVKILDFTSVLEYWDDIKELIEHLGTVKGFEAYAPEEGFEGAVLIDVIPMVDEKMILAAAQDISDWVSIIRDWGEKEEKSGKFRLYPIPLMTHKLPLPMPLSCMCVLGIRKGKD